MRGDGQLYVRPAAANARGSADEEFRYDIIYATLWQFQTINKEAQENLRAGVASIEAEEAKQGRSTSFQLEDSRTPELQLNNLVEEARKIITAFSEEMKRVAEVFGNFAMPNIGMKFAGQ